LDPSPGQGRAGRLDPLERARGASRSRRARAGPRRVATRADGAAIAKCGPSRSMRSGWSSGRSGRG